MISYKENFFTRKWLHSLRQLFTKKNEITSSPLNINDSTRTINIPILPYSCGVPLFSDRIYKDTIGHKELEFAFIVQLPRHIQNKITLEIHEPVKVYRLLSKENNNKIFEDWNQTNIQVNVIGSSCTHTHVVNKIFSFGKVSFEPGGPISSSPIIVKKIKSEEFTIPITIVTKDKNRNHF